MVAYDEQGRKVYLFQAPAESVSAAVAQLFPDGKALVVRMLT